MKRPYAIAVAVRVGHTYCYTWHRRYRSLACAMRHAERLADRNPDAYATRFFAPRVEYGVTDLRTYYTHRVDTLPVPCIGDL